MLSKQIQIHTGFAVKASFKRLRDQQAQIFIALPILTQKHQMVGIVVDTVDAVLHTAAGYIYLTADDRLHPGRLGRFVKIDTAVHHAVIGDRNGCLPQFLHPIHHSRNTASAIKKAVLSMNV